LTAVFSDTETTESIAIFSDPDCPVSRPQFTHLIIAAKDHLPAQHTANVYISTSVVHHAQNLAFAGSCLRLYPPSAGILSDGR
jgi:hypothetical protein